MIEHPENGDSRWLKLFSRKLELETVQAFEFFRSRGIEPILIKGWVAARDYPIENPRFYTDIDIAVSAKDFEPAKKVLASDEGIKIAVDLHRELRHLDTKPWDSIMRDSVKTELDGCDVRIPAPEDHLRILAVHWLNDGGERRDRLWDIFYAVENRPGDFDWDRCLDPVSDLRKEWIIATIGLAHKYIGLSVEGLPFEDRAKQLPQWLIKTVEHEWSSNVRHRSLHTCLNDPKQFLRQLRKRFPPNPLQATIEQEGDIRHGSRLPYQIGSFKARMIPSIRSIFQILRPRSR